MTPHQVAKVVVVAVRRVRERFGECEEGSVPARDPPRPRRWIPRDPNSPGGNRQPPPARGSRGSRGSRIPVPAQHLPNSPSPFRAPTLTLTLTLPAPRRHQPARPRAQSGTEAGACGRRGAGGAGGVSWEAPAPGWGQAEHAAAAAAAGAPSSRRAWGPDPSAARARLPGTALSPSPGAAPRRPAAPEPAPRSQPPPRPWPFGRGGRGGWERGPRSYLLVARSFSGFPRAGIACPGCSDSRAGRRWPRAGTLACEPPARG